ncbi:MAG TPA: adenylate/guanylate cyclase domain-containing protein [Chloroflexia bacterium]|nr:adenylate/guanylate cyclase domain-containing protein [Chloroflexia bacterium]
MALAAPARLLAPYVPRWVRARLPLAPGYQETGRATILYADLRGFTALTQRLALAPDGAKQLGAVLDQIFSPLIRTVHAYGGDVVKFAGDSLTVQFPDAAAAAAAAAFMPQRLPDQVPTPDGPYPLGMRLGIGTGRLTWEIIGDAARGLYWAVHGSALRQALAAEAAEAALPAAATALVRGRAALPEPGAALAALDTLAATWPDEADQAAIAYERWRVQPAAEAFRADAARRYALLYTRSPKAEYRARYRALTADDLPAPPPLPDLPAIVTATPIDLDALIARVAAEVDRRREPA